ncbi:carbonic anhydrase 4-like isoform X2 [Betta splendens]|uniref:Carbonic anhydrase n=1 Tax=Betta splendens TaxID=158456 RepID=A0A6P7LCA1_BETSP|nr:carbonic anhydrase 4-like isoform X2 [Betta splendens]
MRLLAEPRQLPGVTTSPPAVNSSTWSTLFPLYCNGSRQSPINIMSANATANASLTAFGFQNFNNKSAMTTVQNIDNTVRVTLGSGVQISGGGLSGAYDTLQFHFHWGNGSSVPGSEHTVDGKRYAMEMHIVSTKLTYNRNITLATQDPTGVAALGFFIEPMSGNATNSPASWSNLTSYLSNITTEGSIVSVAPGISLDDLLVGVDRTKYYRYLGSLTTPNCNEAVVWTVFKQSIKVSSDLINLFSTTVQFANSTLPMTNLFRSLQPAQPVTTQPASSAATVHCSVALVALVALGLALIRG